MAKEKFEDRVLTGTINVTCNFKDGNGNIIKTLYWNDDKADVVSEIVRIVKKYAAAGYVLTLRQLHYQFVGHHAAYVNHDSAYKKLGDILDDCRYAGLIDWDSIEDRGRVPHLDYWVEDIAGALDDTAASYKLDRQRGQNNIIEVWTEKDALSGIFKRSTKKYHLHLCINKGYTSSSAIYKSYQRVKNTILSGKSFVILYFGDHDPSGLDMIRDVRDRIVNFLQKGDLIRDEDFLQDRVSPWFTENGDLSRLVKNGYISEKALVKAMEDDAPAKIKMSYIRAAIIDYIIETGLFQVIPIGLTMDQIQQYDLPPNPTKLTDSRANAYIKEYGPTCWEVDALEPQVLTEIVESNIEGLIDIPLYESLLEEEQEEREEVERLAEEYKENNK